MDILPRGQSMVFVKKSTFFSYVFSWSKKSQKETFFDILDKNECFLDHKRKVLKNSRKSTFCKGVSPLFLSKNGPFSHMFFFQQKSQKETFFDVLDSKECFLHLNSEVLAKSKISTLQRGQSMVFLKKSTFSLYFFFQQKKPERNIF